MTDHITRVREQAEKTSREAYGFNGVRGHDSRNGTRRKAFIAGAVWLASRLTRENITKAVFPFFEFMDAEDEKTIDRVMELIGGETDGDS